MKQASAASPANAVNIADRLAAIVEYSDDAIISKDLDGIIMSWNRGAERIFGYSAVEAIGKPVLMLIPLGRVNEEPEILARIRRGELVDHYETIRQRKDGSLIDVSVTISPIRSRDGHIVGASKIARDVTVQKRIQRDLEVMTSELAKARDQLEERIDERTESLRAAIAQMEEFSYTVSHDLRAPLRSMKMYSNVLLEELGPLLTDSPRSIHHLNRIISNCERLDHMIQDVLTFGRVARQGIELGPVELDKILADIIYHHPGLDESHAEIKVEPLGIVLGHEPSLVQAISNLMVNAAKFVNVGVKPCIRVYPSELNGYRRIWIEDNGIGIDTRFHHRLFGLFERLHPELPYEGTGVGLAIVAKAVNRMNGKVGVESDGKNGSKFWIELQKVENPYVDK